MDEENDDKIYLVLVNDEEQYSLWRKTHIIPAGWVAMGFEGTREECMKYVDGVWLDMRPASLRKQMDQVN